MDWKDYKKQFASKGADERHFLLGLDVGAATSAAAFYNPVTKEPELIDMSGGYGKPTVPTAAQYIAETGEWVFGEYALLNGQVAAATGFAEKAGRGATFSYGGARIGVDDVLGMYIRNLVESCRSINPKAEIASLTLCVPGYADDEVRDGLMNAVGKAGYGKLVSAVATDRECVLAKRYANGVKKEIIALVDFGAREARGGVYAVEPCESPRSNKAVVNVLSAAFDLGVGTNLIDEATERFFTDFYREGTGIAGALDEQTKAQLKAFAYQHRDLLFRRDKAGRGSKVYYNFAYPPLKQELNPADAEDLLRPFKAQFSVFLSDMARRAATESLSKKDISAVICVGGGFEAAWAREAVIRKFPGAEIVFNKNAKGAMAEGASIIAAAAVGVTDAPTFEFRDKHRLTGDLGVITDYNGRKEFVPLIKRGAFWWQRVAPKLFTVNESTDKTLSIELFKRGDTIEPVEKLTLDALPQRPVGVTRLKLSLEFLGIGQLKITVKDYGFGEMFPVTDYSREFVVNI